jgi:hypothetical protein
LPKLNKTPTTAVSPAAVVNFQSRASVYGMDQPLLLKWRALKTLRHGQAQDIARPTHFFQSTSFSADIPAAST